MVYLVYVREFLLMVFFFLKKKEGRVLWGGGEVLFLKKVEKVEKIR